jgi:hypothetical protein
MISRQKTAPTKEAASVSNPEGVSNPLSLRYVN